MKLKNTLIINCALFISTASFAGSFGLGVGFKKYTQNASKTGCTVATDLQCATRSTPATAFFIEAFDDSGTGMSQMSNALSDSAAQQDARNRAQDSVDKQLGVDKKSLEDAKRDGVAPGNGVKFASATEEVHYREHTIRNGGPDVGLKVWFAFAGGASTTVKYENGSSAEIANPMMVIGGEYKIGIFAFEPIERYLSIGFNIGLLAENNFDSGSKTMDVSHINIPIWVGMKSIPFPTLPLTIQVTPSFDVIGGFLRKASKELEVKNSPLHWGYEIKADYPVYENFNIFAGYENLKQVYSTKTPSMGSISQFSFGLSMN